jgi:hypothetical protein
MTRRQRERRAAASRRTHATAAAPPRASIGADAQRRIHSVVLRYPYAIAAGLALLHVALALLTFEPQPHTGGDNAAYITLGRSLLEHATYTELWDPAEPPHTKYPPAFAVILAAAMAVGLQPWVQLKFVVLGFSAAATALSFLWIRARRRPGLALGIATLIAIAPGVLREGRWILSDVPFWAFTMLALLGFERLRRRQRGHLATAALATLAAYMTRSAGLPLLVAAIAWLVWRRRWHQLAGLAAIVGGPAILWWLRTRAFTAGGYVSEFWLVNPYQPALGTIGPLDMAARVLANTTQYITIHIPTLLAGAPGPFTITTAAAIAVLALAGWALRLRPGRLRRVRVADLFLPLYMGLILIWPEVWSGERFVLPVLPLLLYYAGDALVRLVRWATPRADFAAAATAAVLVGLMAVPGLVAGVAVGRECTARYLAGERYPCLGGSVWTDFFELAETTAGMVPDGAVVLNRKPRQYYVLSGLKGRNYPLSDDPAAFFAAADSAGARYVVFDRLDAVSEIYLRPVLVLRSGAFCLMTVRPASGTALFAIVPPGSPARTAELPAGETGRVSFALCGPEHWRDEEARSRFGVQ